MAGEVEVIFDGGAAETFLNSIKLRSKTMEQGSFELASILSASVYKDVISHFENEEGPDGAWDDWSSIYTEHMSKIGRSGNKILQDTGRLRQSFTPSNYRVISDGILFYNRAKTKTGFPYAYAHNEGGPQLPRRRFMFLSKDGLDSIAEQCLKWVMDVS